MIAEFLKTPATTEPVRFDIGCPNLLVKSAELAGAKIDDDSLETNGWDWDWWMNGTYEDKCFVISGSGYYGHAAIAWSDEEEQK